jgi:predicted Zn-dependent protease
VKLARVALAAALCGVLATPARAQNPFSSDLSVEKEKEMTAQIAAQVRAQVKLVTDPVLVAYVSEIGNELVKTTEPQPFLFRFFLIEDPRLNAFTIGGGYVYITTGVLSQAGDVNEFAGVLAHEIGHVEKRHIARRGEGQGLATLATLASLAAVLAGANPGVLVAAQGLNVSLELKNSREHEAEADREGIAIMEKTGYDPEGMTRFFQRILNENPTAGEGIPAYLYTHPAVKERIAASKVEIERTQAAKSVSRSDPRLAEMQARLAQLQAPGATGTGLHARATFDAAKTDPLLEKAHEARVDGDDERAEQILAQAEKEEPRDPRVALVQAELAQERGDLPEARKQLERAVALDPSVPLVQYQLGSICARLGDRATAAFYLEQAVANFRPNTGARRRAEFELARLEFPLLDESGLATAEDLPARTSFRRGQTVVWWGDVSRRFYGMNPQFRVRWRDPDGRSFYQESLRMGPGGRVASALRTSGAKPGAWKVEIVVEDILVETKEFELQAGS